MADICSTDAKNKCKTLLFSFLIGHVCKDFLASRPFNIKYLCLHPFLGPIDAKVFFVYVYAIKNVGTVHTLL